jgi:hypothetical protein
MNFFENKLKNPLLFKRTLLLVKSWCYYESGILGSNIGLMATYALELLVVYIFNNYSKEISNELDAFCLFFKVYNEIDWEKDLLTIFGLCSIDSYAGELTGEYKGLVQKEEYNNFLKTFEKLDNLDKQNTFKKNLTIKYLNIIDPIFPLNNLGKSINFHNFSKIKKVFEIGHKDIQSIVTLKQTGATPFRYLNGLLKLFQRSLSNSYPEILFQSLLQSKIIICPNKKEEISPDESIEKNSSFKDNLGFFTISDCSIRELNTKYNSTVSEGIKKDQNYATKDILDYFISDNSEEVANYELYYDINTIEKLFNEL